MTGQLPDSWDRLDGLAQVMGVSGTRWLCGQRYPPEAAVSIPTLWAPSLISSPFPSLLLGSESSLYIWLPQAEAFHGWGTAASQLQNSRLAAPYLRE